MDSTLKRITLKGLIGIVVSIVLVRVGEIIMSIPFPFNWITGVLYILGVGYAYEEIGLIGSEER